MKIAAVVLLAFLLLACDRDALSPSKNVPVPDATEPITAPPPGYRKILGQTLYVPVYSSIYQNVESNLMHLTVILSIRNISPEERIIISQVDYYDTNGKLIKKYIEKPFYLNRLGTKEFVIPELDVSGGTGANYLVTWEAEKKIPAPLVETVMIGSYGSRGFAFSSRAQVIEAH